MNLNIDNLNYQRIKHQDSQNWIYKHLQRSNIIRYGNIIKKHIFKRYLQMISSEDLFKWCLWIASALQLDWNWKTLFALKYLPVICPHLQYVAHYCKSSVNAEDASNIKQFRGNFDGMNQWIVLNERFLFGKNSYLNIAIFK